MATKITKSELKTMIREALREELSKSKQLNETLYGTCEECGAKSAALTQTAFGQELCDSCYQKYGKSDKWPIEILLAMVERRRDPRDVSEAELKAAIEAWKKYEAELPFVLVRKQHKAAKPTGAKTDWSEN